ncbi:ORF6C domain-containing protein, partial [[Clostridium] innocuum]|nr:ORF6C domain-containing protein [[Clostridium] innocuum]MCR0456905.1 ORF6C domain-containing protein [[Clostridium] innocuum]
SWVFDEVLPQINHTGGYRVPQNPMEALQLMFDAQRNTDMRVTNLKEDVDNRFKDLPLVGDEPEEIVSEVNAIALKLLGGKKSNAYSDKSLRARVYQDIWHEVKHKFGVRKYKAIKRKYMPNVKAVLEAYTCPQNLLEEILAVNQQGEASCGNT